MSGQFTGERCIIISAPSGAGKTTLVHHLLAAEHRLEFSISATSRPMRAGEADGHDYYFLDAETFKEKAAAGAFVEWEEVYPGSCYGTLRSELQRIWEKGNSVIFEVDVFGGLRLKEIFGPNALSIFVMPPSVEALEDRLRKRSTDSEESMQKRIAKAKLEMDNSHRFDRIVVNDDLEKAKAEIVNITREFLGGS